MKSPSYCLLGVLWGVLMCLPVTAAQAQKPDPPNEITTRSGKTYTGVKVTGNNASHLSILHDAGGARIHFEDLSAELQNQYGYDPFKIWQEDFEASRRLSEATNRPLLIAFVGSDWHKDSQQLRGRVLLSNKFKNYAYPRLVCMEADSPKSKPMAKDRREANLALAEQLNVTELPTIIVLDPAGDELGRLTGAQDDFETFMEALQGVLTVPEETEPEAAVEGEKDAAKL